MGVGGGWRVALESKLAASWYRMGQSCLSVCLPAYLPTYSVAIYRECLSVRAAFRSWSLSTVLRQVSLRSAMLCTPGRQAGRLWLPSLSGARVTHKCHCIGLFLWIPGTEFQ